MFSPLYKLLVFLLLFPAIIPVSGNTDSLLKSLSSSRGLEKASILNQLSKSIRAQKTDSALLLAEEALTLAKQHWDQKLIAESYNNLGGGHYYKGDFRKAASYFREALLIYRLLRDTPKEADMYNNLGVMHRNLGDMSKALDYYIRAMQLKEKSTDPLDVVGTLNNIGGIYYHQKNYRKAEEYYNKVREVGEQLQNNHLMATSYNNLSLVAVDQGNYAEAEEYSKKALDIRRKEGDVYNSAVVFSNLGRIKMLKGEPEEAVKYYLQSVEKYKTTGDEFSYANSLMYVGNAYFHAGNYPVAEKFLSNSLRLATEQNVPTLLRDVNYNYSLVLHKLGRSDEAFVRMEQYALLHDSLLNNESINRIAEMEALYQSSEKEKQIELLKKQNLINQLDNERKKELLQRQKILQYSLFSGFILVFIIAALMYRGYRQKQRINKHLEANNLAITLQKSEIEQKNQELGIKNKEITDSIRYAKRIQQAMLPQDETLKSYFPESFVFFEPKDIVSGDFYWAGERGDDVMLAAADCTGHGVPGAFMSIVGRNLLHQAVNEHGLTRPELVLDELNRNLSQTLQQNSGTTVADGMDIALCTLNKKSRMLEFAGAFNPLYLIRDNELLMFKGNKFPIGHYTGKEQNFSGFRIPVKEGDHFYIFSDGYADQFGGSSGKKFKYSQLRTLLLEIHQLSMEEQHERIAERFYAWKGDMDQVDDVLVIGFKV